VTAGPMSHAKTSRMEMRPATGGRRTSVVEPKSAPRVT
jgi:hypothetical protein